MDALDDVVPIELNSFKPDEVRKLPRACRRRIQKELVKNNFDKIYDANKMVYRAHQQAYADISAARDSARREVAVIKDKTDALELRIKQLREVCEDGRLSAMQKLARLESGIRHKFKYES